MPAFASLAEDYDQQFTFSQIGSFQRRQVHRFLTEIFPKDMSWRVLEFNCGTGQDACWIARQGHTILATDIEATMIKQVQKKIKSLGLEQRIFTRVANMKYIGQIMDEGPFDLIFSNFGGINCLSPKELSDWLNDCAKMLRPGGHLIVVYMGRSCLWEQMYFMLKGKFREAFRRKKKEAQAINLGTTAINSWYYSPAEIKKMAKASLTFKTVRPIGFAIPPSYLEEFFSKRKGWMKMLAKIETQLESISILADFADHSLIHFQKSEK